MDGVLKSWALPHGPTLDPAIKRLAVHVEDHPLDYGSFEGTIPSGNYGAGSVTLWDRGTYEWLGPKTPAQMWESGDLKLRFHGHKIVGEFALVRTNRAKGKDWLLIKKKDFAVREGWDPEADTRSVLQGPGDISSTEGAVKAEMPASLEPMLATLGNAVPSGSDWLYEVKWDGYRALCFIEGGKVRMVSRRGTKLDKQFAAVAQALAQSVKADTGDHRRRSGCAGRQWQSQLSASAKPHWIRHQTSPQGHGATEPEFLCFRSALSQRIRSAQSRAH